MFSLFKNFFSKNNQRKHEKMALLVKKPLAIKEERMSAIEYFCSDKDPITAVSALLARFDFSIEQGIQDEREKNKAMEGILSYSEPAKEIVRHHLLNTNKIAWPVKILSKISDNQYLLKALKECLDYSDTSFNPDATNKNYDILCYLRDFKMTESLDSIAHFLSDPDERVRFAALEVLAEQESVEIKDYIEPFINDDSTENRRLREIAVHTFIQRGWRVRKPELFIDGIVMPGVRVTKEGTLKLSGTV